MSDDFRLFLKSLPLMVALGLFFGVVAHCSADGHGDPAPRESYVNPLRVTK